MTPDELRRLAAAANEADQALAAAILEASREDMPQDVIAAASGRTRERIRQIERAAGLPPRKRGPRAKS
jgi:hypothetical protein